MGDRNSFTSRVAYGDNSHERKSTERGHLEMKCWGKQIVAGGWRKLYNDRTSKFVSSPTSTLTESRTMRMAGHVTDSDKTVITKTASTLQPSILLSADTNNFSTYNFKAKLITVGHDSSVGTATSYELDGPGIKSWWGRHFQCPCRPTQGPIQPPTQWVPGLFPRLKQSVCGVDRPPHLAQRLKKGRAICLLLLWAFMASYRVKITFKANN